MSHSHTGHTGGEETTCRVSMLWNWYTVDACFLNENWHIRNGGMFAATCIGVVLMVVLLEFLRRAGKEYDALIQAQFRRALAASSSSRTAHIGTTRRAGDGVGEGEDEALCGDGGRGGDPGCGRRGAVVTFRASPLQQLVRALLHAMTMGLAYVVMLLAMYFNGYIIISIVIGAFVGKFFCDWLVVRIPLGGSGGERRDKEGGIDEATVCCS